MTHGSQGVQMENTKLNDGPCERFTFCLVLWRGDLASVHIQVQPTSGWRRSTTQTTGASVPVWRLAVLKGPNAVVGAASRGAWKIIEPTEGVDAWS